MKKYFLLVVLLPLFAFSQQSKIDSLQKLLQNAKYDTTRLRLYIALFEVCDYKDNLKYCEPAVILADKLLAKSINSIERKNILKQKETAQEAITTYKNDSIYQLKRNKKLDSLQYILKSSKEDSNKVKALLGLASFYGMNAGLINDEINPSVIKCDSFLLVAKNLSEKIKCEKIVATAYEKLGSGAVMFSHGANKDIIRRIKYNFEAIKIYETIGDKKGIAKPFNNLSRLYSDLKDYNNEILYAQKALEILKNEKTLSQVFSLNNLKNGYLGLKNYSKALDYSLELLSIWEKQNEIKEEARIINSIAEIYNESNQFKKCIEFYNKSQSKIYASKDSSQIISYLLNYGIANRESGEYELAIKYFSDGITIANLSHTPYVEDLHKRTGLFLNFGKTYSKMNLDRKAIGCYQSALDDVYFDDEQKPEILINLYQSYQKIGDIPNAFKYYKNYVSEKDSLSFLINQAENFRQSALTNADYEYKKIIDKEKFEKEKQKVISEEKTRKQKIIIWSVVSGLLLMIVFAGFIFRSLRITRKQKQIIEVQKKEVEKSKHIIEEKNKDITDSINYARRIQQAKLPKYEEIKSTFPESFVLFKPKDIVSGDFYYFAPLSNSPQRGENLDAQTPSPSGRVGVGWLIAAADCTGHGVPGAFMSMIGSEKLDDALAHSADTSEILAHLNKGIKNSLHQSDSDESTRDGMDIALVKLEVRSQKSEVNTIHYAGANRPLWIIRKNSPPSPLFPKERGDEVGVSYSLEEIKATKKAIGGFTEDSQHFDTHIVQLQHGDTFYIFSDGYADTFSKQDKKLTTKKFKEILLSIQDETMQEQEKHLDNFIENWKDGAEQVDDILVIGVRL